MKRITSFIISCLAAMFALTATAQEDMTGKAITAVGTNTPLVADIIESTGSTLQYYVLKNTGRSFYVRESDAADKCTSIPSSTPLVGMQNEELKVLLRFEKAGTGRDRDFRIKTISGKYLVSPTENDAEIQLTDNAEDAGFFEINTTGVNGCFYLRGKKSVDDTTGKNLEGGEGGLVIGWGASTPAGSSGNAIYTFTPVTVEDVQYADVTLKYNIGERTYTTSTARVKTGEGFTVPAVPFVTINSYDYQGQGLPVGVTEINVDCSENVPFKVSEDMGAPIWQAIEVHWNQQPYKWKYEGDNLKLNTPITSNAQATVYDDAFFWAFTGNLIDGFKIYNKAAGTDKYLRKSTVDGTAVAVMSDEDSQNRWFVYPTTVENYDKTTTCCFRLEGDNQYLNHYGSGSGETRVDYITFYGWADNGSTMRFIAPATPVMNLSRDQIGSGDVPLGAVGTFKASREELMELVQAYWVASEDMFDYDKAKALEAAYEAAPTELVEFVPGGYYRVVNAARMRNGQKAMMGFGYIDEGKNYLQGLEPSQSDANFIWKINAYNEGRVRFVNCNTGMFMSPLAGGATLVEEAGAGAFTMENVDGYRFKFTDTQNNVMHQAENGNHWKIIHWEDSYSRWFLMPATELEVSLLTADGDDASYATAYLPFAVSGAKNAEVYTGTVDEEYVYLSEAADGVAANNALVIVGEPNQATATLLIGEGTGTSEGLSGTCQPKDVTAGSVLTLGRCTEYTGAGFYTFTGTQIPANKAYIENIAKAFKIKFGETTSIEAVDTADKAEEGEIYDLSGRRVNNVVKGGIYIRGGEKFIVK